MLPAGIIPSLSVVQEQGQQLLIQSFLGLTDISAPLRGYMC